MPVPTSDLQAPSPSAVIELFELQLVTSLHGSADIYRFHAGTILDAAGPVWWNGNSYARMPIEADGFEYSTSGQLPQPKLRISNINGTVSSLLLIVNAVTHGNDLIGSKLTRIRTLARYIDAQNFPARRNLFLRSDELNEATWTKTRATVATNTVAGPLGEATADLLREDSTASNTHLVEQTVSSLAGGTGYTFSAYFRPAGRTFVQMEFGSGSAFTSARSVVFNLTTGAVSSTSGTVTGAIVDLNNGWYRCSINATTNAAGSAAARIYLMSSATVASYTGDGTSGAYIADTQFEAGVLTDYQDIGASFSQNPYGTPDPTVEFPREVFNISQKSVENRDLVEFTLSAAFDLQGVRAPKRQCIANICQWKYRSTECTYNGTSYFNENDQAVGSAGLDVCGKRLSSCEARFGPNAELPFGSFPGVGTYFA